MAEDHGEECTSISKHSDIHQSALTQLRVDQDSASAQQKDYTLIAPEDLPLGGIQPKRVYDDSTQNSLPKPSKNTLKSPSRQTRDRNQPYSKDYLPFSDKNIPSFETLNFTEEVCKNKNCTCNQKKKSDSFPNKSDKYSLNFAQACKNQVSTTQKTLQEPRLKLHHREKDQRVIIRAARLKLAKQLKVSFADSPAPKSGGIVPETVFGSNAKEPILYPSLLKSKIGETEDNKQSVNKFSGISFGSYRQEQFPATSMQGPSAVSASSDKFNLSELQKGLPVTEKLSGSSDQTKPNSLRSAGKKRSPPSGNHCPLHPGKCKRPCSCAQQAMMDPVDDWTVDELACYFDDYVHIPKKMSLMAEMMYT